MLLNLWLVRPVPDGRKAKLKDKWAFCVTTSLNRNPSFPHTMTSIFIYEPNARFLGAALILKDKTRSIDTVFDAEKESLRGYRSSF